MPTPTTRKIGGYDVAFVPGRTPFPAQLSMMAKVLTAVSAGTNALLCVPPDVLAPCFGEQSFQRHLAAARAANLHARILEIDALALDLDEPADLEELRRRGGGAGIPGIGNGVAGIAAAG